MNDWPIAGRDVHLLGGVHAINLPQSKQIKVFPHTLDGKEAIVEIPKYNQLYEGLKQVGLTEFIGTEFYADVSQVSGHAPCEWRAQTIFKSTPWSHTEAIWHWSHIAHQGYELKDVFLWDIAKRISHQTSTLNESFRSLSYCYRKQLFAQANKNKIVVGSRFEDGFSKKIYDSFQHFLFDACTLRDYLSEFIFHFILPKDEKADIQNMSTTSRIYRKHFKNKEQPTELRRYFKSICEEGGWLNTLGSYRDLVTHVCPLSMASGRGRILLRLASINIMDDKSIPKVIAPIPANPEVITLQRSAFDSFERFDANLKEFFGQANEEKCSQDILTYAYIVMENFSEFIWRVAEETYYKGKKFTLTSKDIVGDIKVLNR